MKYYVLSAIALMLSFSMTSCEDDDLNEDDDSVDEVTILANNFVYTIMDYYYLYNEGISKNGKPVINYYKESDTEEYFYKLVDDRDRFSFITDDAEGFKNSQKGVSESMGWEYTLMYANEERTSIVAAINYVYDNTPAKRAGVKRGDYISTINGTTMTKNNYSELWNTNGKYAGVRPNKDGKTESISFDLTSETTNESPVAETAIFELPNGTKVGYLLYMNFYSSFNDELTSVFSDFKSQGVSKLILDLRYNPGGEMLACSHLASLIAPSSVVADQKEIVYYKYNRNLSSSSDKDYTAFSTKALDANLNLSDVVNRQGSGSYSASEATILGLRPYMDVYTIGYTSGGKNSSMYVMTPDLFVDKKTDEHLFDERIDNWLIAPLVAIYYNSKNETFDTSKGYGMAPDYAYNEFKDSYRAPLGSAEEALTALALEYIQKGSLAESKSSSIDNRIIDPSSYKRILPVQIPFSPYK